MACSLFSFSFFSILSSHFFFFFFSHLLAFPHHQMERGLYHASHSGDTASVRALLKHHPDIDVNWKNPGFHGLTPLHSAAIYGHPAVVAILLEHPGVDVNRKDNLGGAPLHMACLSGRTECARVLLEDPRVLVNGGSNEGYTPCGSRPGMATMAWWSS